MRNLALLFFCLLFAPPSQAQVAERDRGAAPVAPIRPHTFTVHGETLRDDYFWLREKGTPQVDAYLRSERDYAEAYMKPTAALQEQLYKEMVSRLAEDDTTPPYREGTHLYWTRFESFNEYMNWALVGLRYIDYAPQEEHKTLLDRLERFMTESKGFKKFKEFNGYLVELYKNRKSGESLAALYPRLVSWCAEAAKKR